MTEYVSEQRCILVVGEDDYMLEREAMCLLLARLLPDAMVFETFPDHKKFASMARPAGLLFFDFRPPYLKALSRVREMRRNFPGKPLVLLTDEMGAKVVGKVLTHGVAGIVHTSSEPDDMLATIRSALDGKPCLPREKRKKARPLDYSFSPRQSEVLGLLCEGKSNKEIAAVLKMSGNTVRTHISAIFNILGVRNRTEAVIFGRRMI